MTQTASKMGDLNAMMGALTKYTKTLIEMRRQTVKKEGRISGPFTPSVRDIVMIKSDVKINYSRFGVIVKLNSPTPMTICIRYANEKYLEERPVSQVVLIVARCLLVEEGFGSSKAKDEVLFLSMWNACV